MNTREEYYDVYAVYLPVAVAVFALVCGFIGFAVIRGRRRRAEPSRRKNNVPLEAVYVVGLALVTAGLLVLTLGVDDRITSARAGDRGEHIRVLAAQWHWRFEYPEHGVTVDGTDEHDAVLVVPRGVPIDFAGRSLDVIHAFWVPRQRFQRELFNDRVTRFTMTFQAEDDGRSAPCSFFCGLGHPTMRFRIRVLEPADFAAWLREQRAAAR